MGRKIWGEMEAPLSLLLTVAILLALVETGLGQGKWATTAHEQRRAELLTDLAVQNEIVGAAAKDYYVMTNTKPHSVDEVDLDDGVDPDVKPALTMLAKMKEDWNVMKFGPEEAKKLAANGTEPKNDGIVAAPDDSMTSAIVTSATQAYRKATGHDIPKQRARDIVMPRNDKEVFAMLGSVGKELNEMQNKTSTPKFGDVTEAYEAMKDRKINIPSEEKSEELGESTYEEEALDAAMASGTQETKSILGLDKVDQSYHDDKAAAQAILSKQVDETNYNDVDSAIDDSLPNDGESSINDDVGVVELSGMGS